MKNILVINGVNLNMLGVREPSLYGNRTFNELEKYVSDCADALGVSVELVHSNYEGQIVEFIQGAYQKNDGIIINAGAYTHTSIAILDALKAVGLPTVEVHLTAVDERESFRRLSYVSLYAEKKICGKGFEGYKEALEYLALQR